MTERGLYCSAGDFYIDPTRPVDRAVITHAHADHARHGNKSYLAHQDSLPILRQRLGVSINAQSLDYGETLTVGGVKVSLHPAGHILGSAQIRLEYEGWVWVVSGDYKLINDGVCLPFEPVRCHVFITESTFALPLYVWPKQENVFADMNAWWRKNQSKDKATVILCYALGKAQRILKNLDLSIGPVFAHAAIKSVNETFRTAGHALPEICLLEYNAPHQDLRRALILATPASLESAWLKRLAPKEVGLSSGRALVHGAQKKHPAYRNFVLSDHADWLDLNRAIKLSGADKIYTTHGYATVFARWLRETGHDAEVMETA
jgi:putative mRNA 3-end processing factor